MPALTADEVRAVVREAVDYAVTKAVDAALGEVSRQVGEMGHVLKEARWTGLHHGAPADALAARVAEKLAGRTVVGLDAAVLRGLQLMRRHLDEGGHDWRDGTQMADVKAASDWLATEPRLAVDPTQRDRIAELEATVETMKAEVWEANEDNFLCGQIAAEQGCLVANKPSDAVRTLANRYAELREQREADLREAWLAGARNIERDLEQAAAAYARSKAGG